MGGLLHNIATFLGVISPTAYAYPAFDISLPGDRHFHLVGSIHMGTEGMSPLPEMLLDRLKKANTLIIEMDITELDSPFENESNSKALVERLTKDDYQQLLQRCEELNSDQSSLAFLPAWQVALLLQARQAQRLGLRAEYGIDYQLIYAAKAQQKTIIQLEGSHEQMELLKTLPDNGMSLLQDTLTHWHANARLLQTMLSWWLYRQPTDELEILTPIFSHDLYDVLMIQRNRRWQKKLAQLPAGHYVVAVGALHLFGEGNLPQLLQMATQ